MSLRTIILVWRGALEALPSTMALAKQLAETGCDVAWICGTATESNIRKVAGYGVKVIPLGIPSTGYEPYVQKARNAWRFHHHAWEEIQQLGRDALLWVLNSETAIVLGRRLRNVPYVLHLYELHEALLKRRLAHSHVRGAQAVICPESTRASIIQRWHGLKNPPVVIPNVPLIAETDRYQLLDDSGIQSRLNSARANGRRVALYQGLIREDRDLSTYCRVFAKRSDWCVVLMGQDFGCVRKLASLCPNLVHIPHVQAPRHLQVTSWASLGLVVYVDNCLNNRFCAPNKIFEYGMFGIPMLANNVPGLRNTIAQHGAGMCVAENDESVNRAIDSIEENYEAFSCGSHRLLNDGVSRFSTGTHQTLALLNWN